MANDVTDQPKPSPSRSLVPALTMAVPALIFSVAMLSVVFVAAHDLGLSDRQTASLIIGLYGVSGALSLALTFVYRQPLMVAWNINGLIFLASLAGQFSYNEIVGATMVAGIAVAMIGALGLSTRVAAILPPAIVYGLLAGLVLPFIVRIFTDLGQETLLIGAPVVAWLLGRRYLPSHIPPILAAVIVAFLVAGVLGEFSVPSEGWAPPALEGIAPSFSPAAILTISPVIVIFIAAQGNLVASVYLQHQEYTVPQRAIDISTGLTSAVVSTFSAGLVGMASLLAPMTGGPDAGDYRLRHWSVYATGAGFVLIGLLAGMATIWSAAAPMTLLLTLAGLALIGVLGQSLTEITRGPLRLGPLFAFAIASSDLTLLGLGNVFWALVFGTGVSVLLENHQIWRASPGEDSAGEQ